MEQQEPQPHLRGSTVNVYRAGPVRELEHQPMPEIADFEVETPGGPVRFADFLRSDLSTCMGIVVLHRGKIVFEDYPRMEPYERPIYWSVTKVLVSAVVSILEDRGQVEIDKSIETYIPSCLVPRMKGSRSGISWTWRPASTAPRSTTTPHPAITVSWRRPARPHWDDKSADNPYEFIASLKVGKFAEQGTSFEYGSINTYILGWLVENLDWDALSRRVLARDLDPDRRRERRGHPGTPLRCADVRGWLPRQTP